MATVLSPQTLDSQKVRFAHRYKMVVQLPSQSVSQSTVRRRIWAEAPDAGVTRRGSEASEMWTRNAEAPESGGRR